MVSDTGSGPVEYLPCQLDYFGLERFNHLLLLLGLGLQFMRFCFPLRFPLCRKRRAMERQEPGLVWVDRQTILSESFR